MTARVEFIDCGAMWLDERLVEYIRILLRWKVHDCRHCRWCKETRRMAKELMERLDG